MSETRTPSARTRALVAVAALLALARGPGCMPPPARSGASGGSAPVRDATAFAQAIAGAELRIEVCSANVIRVAYARDPAFFQRSTIATAPKRCPGAAWTRAVLGVETIITTDRLKVHVDTATLAVSFHDPADRLILAEEKGGRT